MKRSILILPILLMLLTGCETVLEDSMEEESTATTPVSGESLVLSPVEQKKAFGGLLLSFLDSDGGSPVTVSYRIFSGDDSDIPSVEGSGDTAAVTLPAGNYSIAISWKTGRRSFENLSVTADRLTERPVILDAGILALKFYDTPGGALTSGKFSIFESGDYDTPVIEGYGPGAEFLLPQGSYALRMDNDNAGVWSRNISVSAGETMNLDVIMSMASLMIRFLDTVTGEPAWAEYRMYPAGKWQTLLLWDHGNECTAILEEGTYDFYYAWEDGEGWIQNLSLTAGSVLIKDVPLQ